ncbi:TetR family transcriptional regulator [Labedaea rhizosphaerae]|uniref:TetR family transcriptional regulator n=1 Tax=Labedaea rhizosphaerae TaxID=598644 RepID=A0A4R6SHH5_LABRH|nr:TetR family transcriptional regulator [Labedaea rhizosphaerae]
MQAEGGATRSSSRRERLADAAAELFRRYGYPAVSVADIAAAVGVTGPALYRHFKGKQAILAHVLLNGMDALAAVVDEASVTFAGKPQKALDRIVERQAELSVAHRDISALWRWQGMHLEDADRRRLRKRGGAMLGQWSQLLVRVRPGLSPADADLLCWAAFSVFGSVAVHHASLPKRRFEQLLVTLADAVLSATLPTGADDTEDAGGDESWRAVPAEPSRREELLSVATRLFHQRGFHAVSMEDIGAAAGMAGPSVYRHFDSKASIMLAAAYRMADGLEVDVRRALAAATDPADALHRIVASYVDFVANSDGVAMQYGQELAAVAERHRTELRKRQRDYVAHWVRLLRTLRPEVSEAQARITVHAALTVINDLPRTRSVRTRPALAAELTELAMTVLTAAGRTNVESPG